VVSGRDPGLKVGALAGLDLLAWMPLFLLLDGDLLLVVDGGTWMLPLRPRG
jgi:hypothetical protein